MICPQSSQSTARTHKSFFSPFNQSHQRHLAKLPEPFVAHDERESNRRRGHILDLDTWALWAPHQASHEPLGETSRMMKLCGSRKLGYAIVRGTYDDDGAWDRLVARTSLPLTASASARSCLVAFSTSLIWKAAAVVSLKRLWASMKPVPSSGGGHETPPPMTAMALV